MQKKWIKRTGNIIVLVCILLLIKAVYNQNIDFSEYVWKKEYLIIYGVIVMIYVTTIFMSAKTYDIILGLFGKHKVSRSELQEIYITSNLGKYLPGNVMHFVGRNLLATKYSLKQSDVVSSTFIELILILSISLLLSVTCGASYLINYIGYIFREFKFILIIGVSTTILLTTLIFFICNKFKMKIIDSVKMIDRKKVIPQMARAVSINVIVQLLSSYTYVMIIKMLYPEMVLNSLEMIGVYLLAWTAGFIIPGAPGGVGIKEGILVFLLAGVIPQEIVLVSVVIHRCLNIISELLSFGVIKIVRLLESNKLREN